MKYKPLWLPQAEAFIKSLSPEPRQKLRQALKTLVDGDTSGLHLRQLEGRLSGYRRLRCKVIESYIKLRLGAMDPAG